MMVLSRFGTAVGRKGRRSHDPMNDREPDDSESDYRISCSEVKDSFETPSSSFRHRSNNNFKTQAAARSREFRDKENVKRKFTLWQRAKFLLRRIEVACQSCRQRCPLLCNRCSTLLWCASFIIWLVCFIFQQRMDPTLPNVDHKEAVHKPVCVQSDWHSFSFPNCNDIHDIDLGSVKQRAHGDPHDKYNVLGYIRSGYWRDIWAIDPRADMSKPFVLKIMRDEHFDQEQRNFDRHRRDALAMERLSSSPYIIDIYGYCGNSMVTEYIPTSLIDIIFQHFKRRKSKSDEVEVVTRETEKGRLRLALDAARSLKAIHEIVGGPIVHADLSVKQFMVRDDGVVVLNDFNRCRFMEHDNSTGELCPLRISTAPGKNRSPEEYKKEGLGAKLDVYSLANVLYGIISGRMPHGRSETEVKNGTLPVLPDSFLPSGTIDQALIDLLYRAYAFDPKDRISSLELVTELEKLMATIEQGP